MVEKTPEKEDSPFDLAPEVPVRASAPLILEETKSEQQEQDPQPVKEEVEEEV